MKRNRLILAGVLGLALCSLGALASSPAQTAVFSVPHLYDWKVANGVQKAVDIPAVEKVSMDYDKGTTTLIFLPDQISSERLAQVIRKVEPKAKLIKVA